MKNVLTGVIFVLALTVLISESANSSQAPVKQASNHPTMTVKASWYGPGFHGRLTANGETYDMNGISVAHKTLPFGTWLRVTNLKNNQLLFVRVNDRGPYIHGREIDLSLGAAKALAMTDQGVATVKMEIFKPQTEIAATLNVIYNAPIKVKRTKAVATR